MTAATPSNVQSSPPSSTQQSATRQLDVLANLLGDIEEVAQVDASPQAKSDVSSQNRLAQVRLGIASSLFTALRAKHAPTAAHCFATPTPLVQQFPSSVT